jgi:hypothetical protein
LVSEQLHVHDSLRHECVHMKSSGWVWVALLIGFALIGGGVAISNVVGGFSPIVRRFAEAIAHAEGFYVTGSLPQLYNNPGDLTLDVNGRGVGVGEQNLIQYATTEDGWDALYTQVQKMFDGTSLHYDPSMSILEVAQHYAGDWQNWANNVSSYLGVSKATTLDQLTA